MTALVQEIRQAARTLFARPALAFTVIVTLSLGIGVTTAVFTVSNALLFRPLPYQEPERLVWIASSLPDSTTAPTKGTGLDYMAWRDRSRSLTTLAAYRRGVGVTLTGRGEARRLTAARASTTLLPTLGMSLAQGRPWPAAFDRQPDNRQAAIATHSVWARLFGEETRLSGQVLTLDGAPIPVVGVLPQGVVFPWDPEVELLLPLGLDERDEGRVAINQFTLIGRLRPRVELADARQELGALRQAAFAARGWDKSRGADRLPALVAVEPLQAHLVGNVRPALLVLAAVVCLVLLIACANVANVLLARALARQRELAVRAAIGATGWRLTRVVLIESLLLGVFGGVFGLLLALWGVQLLSAALPIDLAREVLYVNPLRIDRHVLLFTAGVSTLAATLPAMLPGFLALRVDASRWLAGRSAHSTATRPARRLRSLSVAIQVALATVLLVGSVLLMRSFTRLLAVDPGFRPDRVLTFAVGTYESDDATRKRAALFFDQLLDRLAALPDVQSVAFSNTVPLTRFGVIFFNPSAHDRPLPPGSQLEMPLISVSSDYFKTLGLRIMRGRAFTRADDSSSSPVAIVSQRLARQLWGTDDVVGRRFGFTKYADLIVVGVAADVRHEGRETRPQPVAYIPSQLDPVVIAHGYISMRAAGAPEDLVGAARTIVRELDPTQPIHDVATLDQRLATSVGARRFQLQILTLFASLALLLAAVGLYGVVSGWVSERAREIGIRVALGAQPAEILRGVVRQGLVLATLGATVGLAVSLAVTTSLEATLFGVRRLDPATYIIVPTVLIGVALVASYLPARRASRVDPVTTLRAE
ncbi:MAG: FtsX-like permease family protein [Luteitalea sp.]|nr:FtsX-like permease family protein [Luteitalea sp.]